MKVLIRMKVIILAGGLGTRLSEETVDKPKPMVEILGVPILFRIFQIYAEQGFTSFVVALGYKGEIINNWLSSLSIEKTQNGDKAICYKIVVNQQVCSVTTLETGVNTLTGGRVYQCLDSIEDERAFLTYGDGLANVDLEKLIRFHESHGQLVTLTAVQPPPRFGYLEIDGDAVIDFSEKMHSREGWINGGFMVVDRKVMNYLHADSGSFEYEALPVIAKDNNLRAHFHNGFWQPMDTLREKNELSALAELDTPPWLNFG
jgi:glucose-1-phosphate cytidylyltransferase